VRSRLAFDLIRNSRSLQIEVAAIAVIVLLALFLRTYNLTTLPAGFHGDEAVIGLEARRILDSGHIGPYSPYAAGQPTGPIYLVAVSVALIDNKVLAVRLVPALFGTLTVLALYVVMRRNFLMPIALTAAGILAVMNWHLHFSRIGYPVIVWPLLAILIAGALAEAARSSDWRWWAASGALTGTGIYVYNAHPLLGAIVGLFITGYLMVNRKGNIRRDLRGVVVFGVAVLIVMIPMIRFATAENTYYWEHFERDSVTDSAEWQALDGPVDQARFLLSGYRGVWNWLCCEPGLDPVDGTGLTVIVPPALLLLAAFGMIVGPGFYHKPLVWLGVLIVLLLPIAPVVSIEGEARRTLAMAPFLAMFCALGTAGTVELARRQGRRLTYLTATAAIFITGVVVVQNLSLYFRDFAEPEAQAVILGQPIADAAKFLNEIGDGYYVYFFSDAWSVSYATREYLAPGVRGEDRSHEFGEFGFAVDPARGRPLFVFLGIYLDEIDMVRELYPGVEITPDGFATRPTFRVFEPELP
jgi:4-amino-4-deoxy-L-arabinose transferase-like glycosyltransferase